MLALSNFISKSNSFVGIGIKGGWGTSAVCSMVTAASWILFAIELQLVLFSFEFDSYNDNDNGSVVDEVDDVMDDDWDVIFLHK